MLRKIIALCLSAAMLCVLFGCSNNAPSKEIGIIANSNNDSVLPDNESSTVESGYSTDYNPSEHDTVAMTNNDSDTKTNSQDDPQTDSGILIAYFSWSGHTKQLADEIQSLTGGDVFEIPPATPYTVDINELSGIASREQSENTRPMLDSHVDDISKYNIVFVGYPNWWNNMPMTVFTFLEEYDFSEKTVIPFTSYGNGVWGKSIISLRETLPDSTIEDGLAVQEHEMDTMPQRVSDWLLELGIIQ